MLLTLSACATVTPTRTPGAPSAAPSASATPSEDPAQAITAPVTYACKAGKRFTATYPAKGDRAIVAAGGLTKALPLAPSGSGVRYAKDGFEIWGKGDAAMLSGFPGGPYAACQAR
jgi:membrane-bound inhibitor of C-type lysozyme